MKKMISIVLSLLFLFSFTSCSASRQKTFSKDFLDLFDTACKISAFDLSQNDFNKHFETVYKELEEYSKLFDIYKSYGDLVNLKYINDYAANAPVKADEKIIDLLLYGKEIYNLTNGKTNIAMGSVLSLWHQCRQEGLDSPDQAELPDKSMLLEASEHTNIADLIIDTKNNTVFFKDDKMSIDVGAIAKGYVCEKIAAFIKNNDIWNSALISLGGNIKTIGQKNDTHFNVAIENPNGGNYLCTVGVSNDQSVVTSGDYQRYYTVNGKKYCHIIDPQTLFPSEYFKSVTVVSHDSALADAMSTALFVMDLDAGQKLVSNHNDLMVMWVDKKDNIIYSNGFKELVN